MDRERFTSFMKKERRSEKTIASCIDNVLKFEKFLIKHGGSLETATPRDIEKFITSELQEKRVPRYMWTLSYYFAFTGKEKLLKTAQEIRAVHTGKSRRPFKLSKFRGVDSKHIEILATHGIDDVKGMINSGRTVEQRKLLAKQTGLDIDTIVELVKLSDLARLPGVKGIRARLYHDAGLDTLEKIAKLTPEQILDITREFVERTGFDGIPPLPKEAESTAKTAKSLLKTVEW